MAGVPNSKLKAALKKHAGVFAQAAAELGLTRQAVSMRVARSKELQAYVEEVQATIDDLATSVIVDALLKRDRATARWWKERRDKAFAAKHEHTGKDGGPIEVAPAVNVTVKLVPGLAKLPADDDAVL